MHAMHESTTYAPGLCEHAAHAHPHRLHKERRGKEGGKEGEGGKSENKVERKRE